MSSTSLLVRSSQLKYSLRVEYVNVNAHSHLSLISDFACEFISTSLYECFAICERSGVDFEQLARIRNFEIRK